MDLITVLTTPTRPQYLADTLRAVDREGAGGTPRFVCSDGVGGPATEATWESGWGRRYLSDSQLGTRESMWAIFAFALERSADRLLYLEDDLLLSENAVFKMLSTSVHPDVSFVSFYDGKEMPPAAAPGLHKVPVMGFDGKGFWGSLALLIPRRTLEWVVAHPTNLMHRHHCDDAFSRSVQMSDKPFYDLHVPTLVDHIGDVSAAGIADHPAGRRGRNYIGNRRPLP